MNGLATPSPGEKEVEGVSCLFQLDRLIINIFSIFITLVFERAGVIERRGFMLRVLREHATSWMLKGILILVAVTFISWGGYSLVQKKKVSYAAKVDGVVIDINYFNETYQNVEKQYRDALGPSFSEKMAKDLHLRETVLKDLIDRILETQEASRLGLDVSDEELRNFIESIPYFQYNGQFDSRLYERYLRLARMSAEEFERMQRENLMLLKLTNLIKLSGGEVSEDEVLDTFLFENERINLTFLKVAPEAFKGRINANEVEIKDYFQQHQEEFRVPTFVQIQYLIFRPSDFEGKVQVSTDEIKRYYDQQKEQFKTPKKVKAREILIKINPADPPEKVAEKRKKAEEILEKAKKTKDFGSLARQYSESATASTGGDLGWVQEGTVIESVGKALFSAKKGEVSGPVMGRDGLYIFKIEDMTEEKLKPFDEVKNQIFEGLKKQKANNEASRRSDEAFYSLFRSRDLEGYAREKNIPLRTTGFFKEGDEIPEIGRNPSFQSSAFSLKVGEISPVVSVSPNYYILKLLNKKESRIPPLEEVKEEVRKKFIEMKSEKKAREVAEEMLNQIRAGKNMSEVGKDQGIQIEETGFFARARGVVPKIGPVGDFMTELSMLTGKNPLPNKVLQTKDAFFVVKLSATEPADQTKFQSVEKNLQRRLINQKQEEFLQNWLQQLRAKAKIDINKDIL
jgi:peptidyl-prolyl cis-trans isomerase D